MNYLHEILQHKNRTLHGVECMAADPLNAYLLQAAESPVREER